MANNKANFEYIMFEWKIVNLGYFCMDTHLFAISGPSFEFGRSSRSKLRLSLFPRGKSVDDPYLRVQLGLYRSPLQVKVSCECSILDANGSPLATATSKDEKILKKNPLVLVLGKHADVFGFHKSSYLPNQTLTLRCLIWKPAKLKPMNSTYFANTRIDIRRTAYAWSVEYLRDLKTQVTLALELNTFLKRPVPFHLTMSVTDVPNSVITLTISNLRCAEALELRVNADLFDKDGRIFKNYEIISNLGSERKSFLSLPPMEEEYWSKCSSLYLSFVAIAPRTSNCMRKIFRTPELITTSQGHVNTLFTDISAIKQLNPKHT